MKKFEEIEKLMAKRPENLKDLPSPKEMAEYAAHRLMQVACQSAFKIFCNGKFRRLVNFNEIEQVEQDRIFNELAVTAILLIMFTLEAPDLRIDSEMKEYFYFLKDEVPSAHLEWLKELGIDRKHRKLWQKVIDMRYKEYQKDKEELRSVAMKVEAKEQSLTTDKLKDIQMLLPPQVLAIGSLSHIRRGKEKPEDPLFKMLLKWLSRLYIQIRIPIEGGPKITWWRTIIVKLRCWFNR